MNEFISFWFETRVNGVLRFETFIDYLHNEWYTCVAGTESPVVLRGDLDSTKSDDQMVELVKPHIEEAIKAGRL